MTANDDIVATIEVCEGSILFRDKNDFPFYSHAMLQERPNARPFLKWAGGKQWLARLIASLLPSSFTGRYFEPFLGGAAAFWSIAPRKAVLSDTNKDLMSSYDVVKREPTAVLDTLRDYKHSKDFYYEIRKSVPGTTVAAAARLIYLNRTCWNGLYRVNKQGGFNTPMGRYKNPTICDEKRIVAASQALQSAKLTCCDFEKAVRGAKADDLCYFDPPYITGHTNNGFAKYNSHLFSWADQERLSKAVAKLASRGVLVLVSNAENEGIVSLYKGLYCYRVSRRSLIGGTGSCRRQIYEVLISSFPLHARQKERSNVESRCEPS